MWHEKLKKPNKLGVARDDANYMKVWREKNRKKYNDYFEMSNMMTFNYYDYKRKNFDTEDIMDKERTLRNMLKPNTWTELCSTLSCSGFDLYKIQPFWQNHLFVGAIAIK